MTSEDYAIRLAMREGLISPAKLAIMQSSPAPAAGGAGPDFMERLGRERLIDEREMAAAWAREFRLPQVGLMDITVPEAVLELVPAEVARRHGILPLASDRRRLEVAIFDPLASEAIDEVCYQTGLEVVAKIAPRDELLTAIERLYGESAAVAASPEFIDFESRDGAGGAALTGESADGIDATESDAPIIALVHAIIERAVRRKASDIHLEPLEKRFRIRYRIDGMLIEVENPPRRLQSAIISRLKIMANISIAEKRVPQDGRIQMIVGGRALDLRVASLPTVHGESIVMRILDQEALDADLAVLGFSEDNRSRFERLIKSPDGLVLVTGPTGSGKTTTLYSCLHHLNRPDRKLITVEDPVEYQIAGINQVPVRQEIGMTFASALRAMLRQAPNVVMIGEIRDQETAEIAVNASLTGHMVFSTLHTNDAPSAVVRMVDMGVKPFLISSSLRGVLAQRLVRKICPSCSRSHFPAADDLRRLNLMAAEAEGIHFRAGSGCRECSDTGYRGRIGLFELLLVDDEMRRLIHARAGSAQLRAHARAAGMRTLREDGVRQIAAGLTTVEEVVSITVDDLG